MHVRPRMTQFTDKFHWRRNDHGGVSNHQPRGCLLNRLFRRRWKKTSKLRVTGLCAGNSPVPVPHIGPVMRKMFPFDDPIMKLCRLLRTERYSDGVGLDSSVFTPQSFAPIYPPWFVHLAENGVRSCVWVLGIYSIKRRHLTVVGIPAISIRRSNDCRERLSQVYNWNPYINKTCLLSEQKYWGPFN